MQKIKLDLSEKKYAEQSKNKTAMICIYIMNIVLTLAYSLELVKGARTPANYAVFVVLCILPCIISQIIYTKNKSSQLIRYILGIGFLLMYGFVMFTTVTNIVFCYVIVAFVALVVYIDIKFLVILGVAALLLNVARVVYLALTTGLDPIAITETEIIFACLILTGVFVVMAVKKIQLINNAHVDKAEAEKNQSETLLKTTLEVASNITANIENVVVETESLKEAIGQTRYAMSA